MKQHLSNTLGPMHEKVEQQRGRDEKISHIKSGYNAQYCNFRLREKFKQYLVLARLWEASYPEFW